jgi:cobalt/nickel transport system permease protein
LRHARIARWSHGSSVLHRRHALAKILVGLVLLVSIASLNTSAAPPLVLYAGLLLAGALAARLPLMRFLFGVAVVLPFALTFAVIIALAGDPARALAVTVRACLSALTALLLVATTPVPDLLAGFERLGAPAFLLQVTQFLHRYLIVLIEEMNAMRVAALSRAGTVGAHDFRLAAAAAGVLFSRSYARAQAIHRAMLARGFEGQLPRLRSGDFHLSDAGFLAGTVILVVAIRAAFR